MIHVIHARFVLIWSRLHTVVDTSSETGIRVFRNLDDALEWVLAKSTTA